MTKKDRVTSFKIVQCQKKAICEACGEQIGPNDDGSYEVSPHLREAHGYTGKLIVFKVVGEVICPPMTYMEARQ